ncbi:MAG: hypothetical protein M3R51_05990, partial [Candidatus Eremiobacteraeota bacterium]|nr:hypothetical protein [Candidatus Eremiobacteraeota bacterium]
TQGIERWRQMFVASENVDDIEHSKPLWEVTAVMGKSYRSASNQSGSLQGLDLELRFRRRVSARKVKSMLMH